MYLCGKSAKVTSILLSFLLSPNDSLCACATSRYDFLLPSIMASWHPLSRFPLFLMGIYAGILSLRHPPSAATTTTTTTTSVDHGLPWPSAICRFFPTFRPAAASLVSSNQDEERAWVRVADYQSLQLLLVTALVATVNEFFKCYNNARDINAYIWFTGTRGEVKT